jgi:hypothetical protein
MDEWVCEQLNEWMSDQSDWTSEWLSKLLNKSATEQKIECVSS